MTIDTLSPSETAISKIVFTIRQLCERFGFMEVDITNKRIGINKSPGAFDLDVSGAVQFGSTVNAVTGYKVNGAATSGNVLRGDGTNFISATLAASDITSVRVQLTGNRTYYVRTDGSNSNTGLVDSAGGAFLTIQKAIDTVASIDIAAFNVTIQVGNGTYTGTVVVTGPWVGGGTVTLSGDTTTPSNVVVSVTSNNAITVRKSGRLSVQGLKITTTSAGVALLANSFGAITCSELNELGSCAFGQLQANTGTITAASVNFTVSGGALSFLGADRAGHVSIEGGTVTFTGTPTFTDATASARAASIICTATLTGAATGVRYRVVGNGAVITGGAGATYFPGNVAGVTTPDNEYA